MRFEMHIYTQNKGSVSENDTFLEMMTLLSFVQNSGLFQQKLLQRQNILKAKSEGINDF